MVDVVRGHGKPAGPFDTRHAKSEYQKPTGAHRGLSKRANWLAFPVLLVGRPGRNALAQSPQTHSHRSPIIYM